MKSCPKCLNLSEDSALACEQCGTVLNDAVIAQVQRPAGRLPTVSERIPDSSVRPSPPPPRPSTPATGSARPGARRGETVFLPPSQAAIALSAAPPPRAEDRKIVAALVTWDWKASGQIFPVREGRNLIGRGEECDIRVEEDPAMSQVNSHITFRRSFTVGDMVSMSGTDLNGTPVEEQFCPLANYGRVRTGSTHWTFIILDAALASTAS